MSKLELFMYSSGLLVASVFLWFATWEALECDYYKLCLLLWLVAVATGICGELLLLKSLGVKL